MSHRRFPVLLFIAAGVTPMGAVAGVMTAPLSQVENAIPAQVVLAAASQGYLGVNVRDLDAERAQKLNLNSVSGAEVVSLDHDAPAAKAGVHTGDIIQALNGQPISDAATLTRLLRDMPIGKVIDLQIFHDRKVQILHVQLADRKALIEHAWLHHFRVPLPEPTPSMGMFQAHSLLGGGAPENETPDPQAYIGAQTEPLTPQLAKFFGVHAGNGLLVRSVEDRSPASNAGIEAGDVLLGANGQALETTSDWIQTLRANANRPVTLVVLRNRKVLQLSITVDARITQSELVLPESMRRLRRSLERYSL